MTYQPWKLDILIMPSNLHMQKLWEMFDYREGQLYRKNNSGTRWKSGQEAGSQVNEKGYRTVRIDGVTHRLHKVVFCMFYGYAPEIVDHINNVQEDNRIENLREASRSENQWNSKVRKSNTSGVKGVSWHKTHQRWVAEIVKNNKTVYSKRFKSLDQARVAIEIARSNIHGEFARHI